MLTRRRFMFGALAPVVGAASLAAPVMAGKKTRKKGTKVVTRTFKNTTGILILDKAPGFPYPSKLKVSGLKEGKVLDVNLVLRGFSHPFPSDVHVMLVSPNGQAAVVMSGVGGLQDAVDLTLTLDDQAAQALGEGGGPLTSGSFRPAKIGNVVFPDPAPGNITNSELAVFKGGKANGVWKLYVFDDDAPVGGVINSGWELKIRARVKN